MRTANGQFIYPTPESQITKMVGKSNTWPLAAHCVRYSLVLWSRTSTLSSRTVHLSLLLPGYRNLQVLFGASSFFSPAKLRPRDCLVKKALRTCSEDGAYSAWALAHSQSVMYFPSEVLRSAHFPRDSFTPSLPHLLSPILLHFSLGLCRYVKTNPDRGPPLHIPPQHPRLRQHWNNGNFYQWQPLHVRHRWIRH